VDPAGAVKIDPSDLSLIVDAPRGCVNGAGYVYGGENAARVEKTVLPTRAVGKTSDNLPRVVDTLADVLLKAAPGTSKTVKAPPL
jgi:hypothetical protein